MTQVTILILFGLIAAFVIVCLWCENEDQKRRKR